MRPLILCGAAGIAVVVIAQMFIPDETLQGVPDDLQQVITVHAPVWPLLLAGAAFLSLWWLATLIFDLVFVWQRYVRNSVALDRLHNWTLHDSNFKRGSTHGENPPEPCREAHAVNVAWPSNERAAAAREAAAVQAK